jgi:multisubunit Na+/H+ antiporter MnhC subunit
LVITFIVVEVSLVATALALVINIYRHTKGLDVRSLAKLKG